MLYKHNFENNMYKSYIMQTNNKISNKIIKYIF